MTALLAFDTATERLHVGLKVDGAVWQHEGEGGARASAALIPVVRELLRAAGIGLRDVDAIAFGRGPGAFTGLRTASAVAQGLALGASKPVLAIDTLMAVAEDARTRRGTGEIWVAMDARMGEIYAAHYRPAGARWQIVVAPALYKPEELESRWRERAPPSVAGTALTVFGARIDAGAAVVASDAGPTARALLACAEAAWADDLALDAAATLPLYLRDRVALTTAEREAGPAQQAHRTETRS